MLKRVFVLRKYDMSNSSFNNADNGVSTAVYMKLFTLLTIRDSNHELWGTLTLEQLSKKTSIPYNKLVRGIYLGLRYGLIHNKLNQTLQENRREISIEFNESEIDFIDLCIIEMQ